MSCTRQLGETLHRGVQVRSISPLNLNYDLWTSSVWQAVHVHDFPLAFFLSLSSRGHLPGQLGPALAHVKDTFPCENTTTTTNNPTTTLVDVPYNGVWLVNVKVLLRTAGITTLSASACRTGVHPFILALLLLCCVRHKGVRLLLWIDRFYTGPNQHFC